MPVARGSELARPGESGERSRWRCPIRNAVVSFSLLLVAGCGLASFDVPVSGSATIPGSPLGALEWADQALPLPAALTSFSISDAKEFKNEGAKPGDVESVKLTSMKLRVTEGDDLDFLEKISFFAATEGKPEILIAEGTIPKGARSVNLRTTDAELKNYALAPKMTVTAKGTGRPPLHDTTLEVKANFFVKVF